MRVTGTPYSRAEMAVHFPVPFCPALSLIFGSRCLPSLSWNLRMLAVISIRNESSSVLFHSSNAFVQDGRETRSGRGGSLNPSVPPVCRRRPATALGAAGRQAAPQRARLHPSVCPHRRRLTLTRGRRGLLTLGRRHGSALRASAPSPPRCLCPAASPAACPGHRSKGTCYTSSQ